MANFLAPAFMQHALLAGTAIALAAGLAGYLLVLRAQVFATDALGHVAYTGAIAALAYGFDPRLGLTVATVITAVGLAGAGRNGRPDDVAIGSTFGWLLALGSFFLTVYTTQPPAHSASDGGAGVSYLFGSIFGITGGQARLMTGIAVAAAVLVVAGARPLLFASVDESVAAIRGVPVRLLGIGFLVLVGMICAQATQAVGALLFLGLVAAPAGAAHRLTTRPYFGMVVAAALAIGSVWIGLAVSFYAATIPPSFSIIAVATLAYAGSTVASHSGSNLVGRLGRRPNQGANHVRRPNRPASTSPPWRRARRARPDNA